MTTQNQHTDAKASQRPTHYLRRKIGYGRKVDFETIGVAWAREDGGFYIKLYGTQIIDSGFYAVPIKDQTEEEGGQ